MEVTHICKFRHHLQIPRESGGGRGSEAVGKRFHGRLHEVIRHGRPWVQPRQHQQTPSARPENSAGGSGVGQGSRHREAGNCQEGAPTPTQAGPPLGSPKMPAESGSPWTSTSVRPFQSGLTAPPTAALKWSRHYFQFFPAFWMGANLSVPGPCTVKPSQIFPGTGRDIRA